MKNGAGTINLNGKNYDLNIKGLTEKNIDLSVSDYDKILYQYDKNSLGYNGQASIAIGGIAWVLFQLAISVLVTFGIIQVLQVELTKHGYEWYDGEESAKAMGISLLYKKTQFIMMTMYYLILN